jgi:hypothetical protein
MLDALIQSADTDMQFVCNLFSADFGGSEFDNLGFFVIQAPINDKCLNFCFRQY